MVPVCFPNIMKMKAVSKFLGIIFYKLAGMLIYPAFEKRQETIFFCKCLSTKLFAVVTMNLDKIHLYLLIFGLLVVVVGIFSRNIKDKWLVSVPLIALLTGILSGPQGVKLLNPGGWEENAELMLEASRFTLAISLMGVALRLPKEFLKKYALKILLYIIVLMIFMFAASTLISWIFLGTGFWVALLIGASITPTDPVVSSAIVTGEIAKKFMPGKVRNLISTESGFNDGLTILFFNLPFLILTLNGEYIWTEWIKKIVWDVLVAGAIGICLGWGSGKLLELAEKKQWIGKTFFLGYSIAVSLLTLGITRLIDSNAVFAVFAAGIAFSLVIKGSERHEEENTQEAVNHFFVIPVFVLFGILLPWNSWSGNSAGFYLFIPAVLLFRRLPWMFIAVPLSGIFNGSYNQSFTGWFGPIGVAAIFYLSEATMNIQDEIIWSAGTLVIFSSVVIHGITATPLSRRYEKISNKA